MKAGDILDVTLRSMRVVDVKPGSTLLVGSLPNGEPFEVRVPFDADVRTAPVERPTPAHCPEWEQTNDDHSHDCDRVPGHVASHHCHGCNAWWRPYVPVTCACTLEDDADHTHRCVLDVDNGPHADCNHLCECGKQWGGA